MIELKKLETVMRDLALPTAVTAQVLTYISQKNGFEELLSEAYQAEDEQFDILRRKPFTRLAIACGLLVNLQKKFEAKGIPKKIWLDSIDDIPLRQKLYFEQTGKIGLAKADARWLRHLFRFQLFKIGSLQFQPFLMLYLDKDGIGRDFMTFSAEQKRKLPPGTPVLNTHIQFGANLDPLILRQSFDQARDFFRQFFPEHHFKAFICYTWLLHPGNKMILEADSKILQFASLFEIISKNDDKTQALERIFGGRRRRHSDYPQETRLQRAALKNLNVLGYACGLIPF